MPRRREIEAAGAGVIHYIEWTRDRRGDSALIQGCGARENVSRRTTDKKKVTCSACRKGIRNAR